MDRLGWAGLICCFFLGSTLVFPGAKKERYPQEIAVSYAESPFNIQLMVMKERGMLETAFREKNIRIAWHHINSGAYQTQAMAAGSLDIAPVINSISVLLANAAGNRVEIAAMVSRPSRTFALVTGPGGPRSIQELRGKTIAGPKGTVLHQMLLAALQTEGMRPKDITFISMDLPEARAALLSGSADGALQAAAMIIRGKEAGLRVLFTADGYVKPLLATAVRPAFARQYPELLELYLKTQMEAYRWILDNTEAALAIGAAAQGISLEDAQELYAWNGMDSRFTPEDLAGMRADAAFLLEQGMIVQPVNPGDFIRSEAWAATR
ncbi:MAG: ABC transporter substrate-binding protein [Treponema sp.]|jgi:ABC-type nitrate/sulfonate/bicarbonate transport system substrate-binding protein|nr:ABC transporter substrate-binding protein [Treponema sp.]